MLRKKIKMERSHSATNQSGTEPQAANGHLYDGGTQKRRKVQQQTEEYLRNAIRIMTPCQPVENAAFATSRNTRSDFLQLIGLSVFVWSRSGSDQA